MVTTNSRVNIHSIHKVLGRYCWTCGVKTQAGVPGWPPALRGPMVHYGLWDSFEGKGATESIVWANGDETRKRDGSLCSVCELNCAYPVERTASNKGDSYREINKSMLR